MNIENIDAVAVAKMIRKDLKAAFPGTKFSVRKNGYDCVTINWTDGPASDAVMAVAKWWKSKIHVAMRGGYAKDYKGREVSE